jgi:hypothetical protein
MCKEMNRGLLLVLILAGISLAFGGQSGASILVVPPEPEWERMTGDLFGVPSGTTPDSLFIPDQSAKGKDFLMEGNDVLLSKEDPWVRIAVSSAIYDLSTIPFSLDGTEELRLYSGGSVVFDDRGGLNTLAIPKPIPELATALLIGFGFMGLYGFRRRMRKK